MREVDNPDCDNLQTLHESGLRVVLTISAVIINKQGPVANNHSQQPEPERTHQVVQ